MDAIACLVVTALVIGNSFAAEAVQCQSVAATSQSTDRHGDDDQAGSGTGGTGMTEPTGSGTGGTGMIAQTGTGNGGTGLYGTIIAFGSVCVNGLKIEYDAETPLVVNGRPGRAADLELGHIVRIETLADAPNQARQLTIENPIGGPLERVDVDGQRVFIMGAEVELRHDTVIRGTDGQLRELWELEPGDHVGVSGLRRSDGVVVASRLDQRPAGMPSIVTDLAVPVGSRTFYVGRVRGQIDPGIQLDPALRRARIQLRGKWNRRTRTLEDASVRAAPVHVDGLGDLSIQGYVARDRKSGGFVIAGTRVSLANATGTDRAFHLDTRVNVRGKLDDTGRLEAQRIVVEEPGRPEAIIGRSPQPGIGLADLDDKTPGARQTLSDSKDRVEEHFDTLDPEDLEEIEARMGTIAEGTAERLERLDHENVERISERIERLERDDLHDRIERLERDERVERIERVGSDDIVERVERIDRDDLVERAERKVREQIDRFDHD